jgi:hypothetical protein
MGLKKISIKIKGHPHALNIHFKLLKFLLSFNMGVIVCGLYGYGLYDYMVMHHMKAIGYGFKFLIFGFKVCV